MFGDSFNPWASRLKISEYYHFPMMVGLAAALFLCFLWLKKVQEAHEEEEISLWISVLIALAQAACFIVGVACIFSGVVSLLIDLKRGG